jgi:hypothetical protein
MATRSPGRSPCGVPAAPGELLGPRAGWRGNDPPTPVADDAARPNAHGARRRRRHGHRPLQVDPAACGQVPGGACAARQGRTCAPVPLQRVVVPSQLLAYERMTAGHASRTVVPVRAHGIDTALTREQGSTAASRSRPASRHKRASGACRFLANAQVESSSRRGSRSLSNAVPNTDNATNPRAAAPAQHRASGRDCWTGSESHGFGTA